MNSSKVADKRKASGPEYQRGRNEALDAILALLHSERDHNVIRKEVERLRFSSIAEI